MRPFLKWAGGKHRIVDRVRASLPPGKRLVEPFVGSGAVFLNTDYPNYLLADTNPDLIGCYRALQRSPESLIAEARAQFTPEGNSPTTYYRNRETFNRLHPLKGDLTLALRKAALFIYLNRHGFNGLCRYNQSGEFNVPFGRYARAYFPEVEMRTFAEKLQAAELHCTDFLACLEQARGGDVVYCDPPYVPLSSTANFTAYAKNGFCLEDQEALNQQAQALSHRGIPVVISNHETALTRKLYSRARRISFPVRRHISCKGDHRAYANELIAVYA